MKIHMRKRVGGGRFKRMQQLPSGALKNGNRVGMPSLDKGKYRAIRSQECQICLDRSMDEWEKLKGEYTGSPGQEPAHKVTVAPAPETECLFWAGDLPMLLPPNPEETSPPTPEDERRWQDKNERTITSWQSDVIETCLDAADDGATIASCTRDLLTSTAYMAYQFAITTPSSPGWELFTISGDCAECPCKTEVHPPTPHSMSEGERRWHERFARACSPLRAKVIETCMDAADHGATIAQYTRDRILNTAVITYQFATRILSVRGEP